VGRHSYRDVEAARIEEADGEEAGGSGDGSMMAVRLLVAVLSELSVAT
jgi:hypothetical protein